MPPDDRQLLALAGEAGQALSAAGWRVALAESCTGGWLCKALTDVAGSSEYFTAGFTTYSNESKQQTLGVAAETLVSRGAVSREVVLQMAAGAQRLSERNWRCPSAALPVRRRHAGETRGAGVVRPGQPAGAIKG